jgi:hypothetical protein
MKILRGTHLECHCCWFVSYFLPILADRVLIYTEESAGDPDSRRVGESEKIWVVVVVSKAAAESAVPRARRQIQPATTFAFSTARFDEGLGQSAVR